MICTHDDYKITEIELIYINKLDDLERPQISNSADAYKVFFDNWDKGKLELQEQFKIMLLDQKNSVLGISTLSAGGISQCAVDIRLAFAAAVKGRATGMILAHNHPSGNKKFSEPDKELTKEFVMAGNFMKVPILDHIVVTRDGYVSMSDEGTLPAIHLKL